MKILITLSSLFFIALVLAPHADAATLSQLNKSITRAEKYYDGLYRDLGPKGAVMAEYYSGDKSSYTVRHGAIGGYYYYSYIGDKAKAAQLKKFVTDYGFKPSNDIHSFIWSDTTTAKANDVYSLSAYHDCDVTLPQIGNVYPYHSKVCKLGTVGIELYTTIGKTDTLLPTINQLQKVEEKQQVDTQTISHLQNTFKTLGYGMPLCSPLGCQKSASAIRTAEFGVLEMKLDNMQYADKIAEDLLRAENKDGSINLSYDKDGNFLSDKSFIYKLIDNLLGDKSFYNGHIPSNAETMNDCLAFLLKYRCDKYHVCK